jgi:hypothetical protein
MIPQRNLSLLSNRLFREQGGRRIPEAVLQRDYCLAWFLATLATHPMREHLAFKSGTALRRCHFANYRFSEDLDFTLLHQLTRPDTEVFHTSEKNEDELFLVIDSPYPSRATKWLANWSAVRRLVGSAQPAPAISAAHALAGHMSDTETEVYFGI